MSSVLYAHVGCWAGTNSAFGTDFKQVPMGSTMNTPYLTRANLTEFALAFKALKELVQAMARLAAEQEFKN